MLDNIFLSVVMIKKQLVRLLTGGCLASLSIKHKRILSFQAAC